MVLLGGTFDPPHLGHLLMGQLALEQTSAAAVWYVPAPAPPHKLGSVLSDYGARVQMTKALIEGHPGLTVCELESHLPQPSYTVDTLRACRDLYPEIEFQFLLGSDSLAQLPTWHQAAELTQLVDFVVAVRVGYEYEKTMQDVARVLPDIRAQVIEMPMVDVSSTFVRNRLQQRKSICGFVPNRVMEIWLANHRGELQMGETAGE